MNRRLRWKLVVILAVVIGTSAIAWFPPLADRLGLPAPRFLTQKRLRLGLDLRGGVQFVLQVNADEALTRVNADEAPTVTRDEIVAQAREAIDRRVNALGVLEPVIAVQGDRRDQIVVQLPGFTDVERARSILGATARLEWGLVDADPSKAAALSGRDIRRAWPSRDDFGQPAVGFSLTPEGGRRFAELTSENIGRQVAIVLDDQVQSAPVIESAITGGEGIIRGGFSVEQAADLALLLQSGALPVSMTFLGGGYVGPTLGASAVKAGLTASVGGLLLVAAFMLVYYRRAGVNAVISVVANLAILLGAMASLGAAMTLPGVAGFILTIGMGVDSNVLIFERIKEELKAGQSVRRAVAAGFDRVFLTILDTHVTSLVAAAFLFQFGSGAIRGFATTLSLGLLTNLFTAVFVSRAMFELTLARGRRLTLGPAHHGPLTTRAPLDVMSRRTVALWVSAAIIATGLTVTMARGLSLGLDFTGGAAVVAQFDGPVSEEDVRQAIPRGAVVQRYGAASDRTLQIRLPQPAAAGGDDEAGVRAIETALRASSLPASRMVGTTTIGPTISRDLQRKGAYAIAGALAGITAYLALRFRPSFATGAAVAVGHDIVVTVAMLSLGGYDLDLNVVAALLTVAGYSVNDTIVIFDRIRERLRTMGRGAMSSAINSAVTDTLGRTIITSGTTLATVLALYLFGGPVLRGFSFTVLVGIVVGTWSSVFVAAPVAALVGRRAVAQDGSKSTDVLGH
jgi:preprotein translocase SecF subunit